MLYANRAFLIKVTDYDGILIAQNDFGERFEITKDRLNKMYTPVYKVRHNYSDKELANIAEAYKQSWVGFEDEEYIEGTRALHNHN